MAGTTFALVLVLLACVLEGLHGFGAGTGALINRAGLQRTGRVGARSMTSFMDVLAALSIATSDVRVPAQPVSSSVLIAEVETRQGLYKEYTVEKATQKYDDIGSSGIKPKETLTENKNKYIAVIGVLLGGAFIIPMVQYYWYIRDSD